MKAIELMKSDFFFFIFFALLSLFSISFVHFSVLILQDVFFDTQNYLKLLPYPNFLVITSGLSLNFILFNWLAIQIEKEEKNVINDLSNSNIY